MIHVDHLTLCFGPLSSEMRFLTPVRIFPSPEHLFGQSSTDSAGTVASAITIADRDIKCRIDREPMCGLGHAGSRRDVSVA